MKHPTRRLQLNNEGTTLVELIVSLLVLTIIVVPLLNGFVIAQKANATAKGRMYAVSAAENIMEAVKAIGPDANAISHGLRLGVSRIGTTDSYWVANYTEGTEAYDVKLTISPSGYSENANKYKFATMSAFNEESSITIFPGKLDLPGQDFNANILNQIAADNREWMGTKWAYDSSAAATQYLEDIKRWEEGGRVGDSPVRNTPDQSNYEPASIDLIKSKTYRTTTIDIDEIAANVIGEDGVVKTEYTYKLDSKVRYSVTNSYIPTRLGYEIGMCTDPGIATWEKEYGYYCDASEHKGLKSIYLIYEPFGDETSDHSSLSFVNENVEITSKATQDINVFIVVQSSAEDIIINNSLNVLVNKNSGKVNLYINSDKGVYCTTADKVTKEIVEDMKSTLDRIYTVTVDIYSHGDSHDGEEPITSLSSTVLKLQ